MQISDNFKAEHTMNSDSPGNPPPFTSFAIFESTVTSHVVPLLCPNISDSMEAQVRSMVLCMIHGTEMSTLAPTASLGDL